MIIINVSISLHLCALNLSSKDRFDVTIGIGDQLARKPIDFAFRNGLFETLYYPDEIGSIGTITSITFYNDFAEDVFFKPTKIWLGTTNMSNLNNGWISSTQLTPVFDGLIDYPSGQNLITITLQNHYTYQGGFLVLLVHRPVDTQIYNVNNKFLCQSDDSNRTINYVTNSTLVNPANPPNIASSNLSAQFPKITIHMILTPTEPVLYVQPNTYDFGNVVLNSFTTKEFVAYNMGTDTLLINNISVLGSPYYDLHNVPMFPIMINAGQSFSFSILYHPLLIGLHNAQIAINTNLDPQIYILSLAGNSNDVTIYNLPYIYGFDDVTLPDLPLDWSCIVEPQVTLSSVSIVEDTTSPSLSNCVLMMNGDIVTGNIMLISPPLSPSIPVNSCSVTFWAQSYPIPITHNLSVGVMTDPLDALSYTEIQSVVISSSSWTQYTVSFHTYLGNGRYIVFKHPQEWSYIQIKIDSIIIESLLDNDLAASLISGDIFPTVDNSSLYYITISNCGNATQSNYQIKLLREGDIEIGSAWGPVIQHGETLQVVIPWIPQETMITNVYGKVFSLSDSVLSNNQTQKLRVNVQNNGANVSSIGIGNELARNPIDFYRKNSLFETVYLSSEINNVGWITGLEIYNDFQTILTLNKRTKIWLGATDQSNLDLGWIPSTLLNTVFDDTVNYPPNENAVYISFQIPYYYIGENLAMMINRPMDMNFYNSSDYFRCQTIGNNRTRMAASDNVSYSSETPPLATLAQLSGRFPQSVFFIQGFGTGIVQGIVVDSLNNPISGVDLISGNYMTETDLSGFYRIYLPQGIYDITAIIENYNTIVQTGVMVNEGHVITANFILTPITGVTEDIDNQMFCSGIMGVYPNPFYEKSTIQYMLKDNSAISLEIYNIKGQLIKTLVKDFKQAGKHIFEWDGSNTNGKILPGGIYLCKMKDGESVSIKKMIKF
jgi:hypothetical protein